MLTQTQHAVEGHASVVPRSFIDGDAVDYVARAKIFQHPKQVLWRDAKHRRAHAHTLVQRDDLAAFQLFAKAIHQMNFRAHGPLRFTIIRR